MSLTDSWQVCLCLCQSSSDLISRTAQDEVTMTEACLCELVGEPNPDQALIERLEAGDSEGNRILMPELAIQKARETGCELAVGCVVLIMETSGGQNIYGHDSISCADPPYEFGGPVTQENYTAYLASRDTCGTQGVGPVQLTWFSFQDDADALGGCWRPDINIQVGFALLADYTADGGYEYAFRTYNGTQRYADRAMSLLPEWQAIVAG